MSNKRVQFRRGTTAQHSSFTGAAGEVTVDTDNNSLVVHDNSTAGGIEQARADLENISPDASVNFNSQKLVSVADPTAAQDAATKAYVDSQVAGGSIDALTDTDVSNPSGGHVLVYDGTNSWDNVALSGDATLASDGALTISASAVETSMLADNAVTTAKITDASVTNAKLANSSITLTDGTNSTAIALGGTATFSGTASEVEVSENSGTVTIGLPDDVTIGNNLVVTGNLTVSGTTTTINTTNLQIEDNIVVLNHGTTGAPSENAGLEVERGDSSNVNLRWNETSDKWEVTTDGTNYYELVTSEESAQVSTDMLDANAVTTAKITDANVTTAKLADDAVTQAKIADDAVGNDQIADDAVDSAQIADNAVVTANITDANVTTAKLADDAVTSAKISFVNDTLTITSADLLVANAQSQFTSVSLSGDATIATGGAITIGNSAITTAKINDSAVTTAKVNDSAITSAKIAADAIDGSKIADDAIDSEHYVALSIDAEHLAASSVTTAKIADSNVTEAKLASDSVATAKIIDSNVTTAKLADDAVTAAKIDFLGTVATNTNGQLLVADATSGTYESVSVSGDATLAANGALTISASAVETSMIAADAVNGSKIADDSIDSEHYVDGSIDTAHIADDAVTAAKTIFIDDNLATTNAHILVSNGDSYTNVAISGDVSMANTGAVTIATSAVETAMIADANVTTAKLAADAVTAAKLADNAVVTANITDANVTTAKLADDAVTTAKIASDAVTKTEVAFVSDTLASTSGHVLVADGTEYVGVAVSGDISMASNGAVTIANSAVETAMISDDNVTAAKVSFVNDLLAATDTHIMIADGTSFSNKAISGDIAISNTGAVTIANSAVETAMIADANVTSAKLASNAVTTAKITDSNVTNAKLANSSITLSDGTNSTAIALGSTATFSGTVNEIEVSESGGTVTVGLPTDVVISNDLSVTGEITAAELDISGRLTVTDISSTATIEATVLKIDDSLVQLNTGNATNKDIGIYGIYDTVNSYHAGIIFDDTDDTWKVIKESADASSNVLSADTLSDFDCAGLSCTSIASSSGVTRAVATLTSATTLTASNHIVLADSASAFDITLPHADAHSGREYIIRNIGSGNPTLKTADNDWEGTSGNASETVLSSSYFRVISDGTNWWRI